MVPEELRFLAGELRDHHHDDPWWWRRHLVEAIQRYVNRPVQRMARGYDGAVDVMERDWDTLVVLDACRADLFETVAAVDAFDAYDAYERVTSPGSMTPEWVARTFAGRSLGDTVYVSANPYVGLEAPGAFHHREAVWREAFDDEAGTVLPGDVADAARAVHEAHPHKRLVVHFVQPHHPFVADDEVAAISGWDVESLAAGERPPHPHDPFEAYSMGELGAGRLWEAYAETLDLALEYALALAADLPGRTVLTADHGNMVGGDGWPVPLPVCGHYPGLRQPELVSVPWAVLDDDRRRRITADGTGEGGGRPVPDRVAADRLERLGYV